MKKFGYINFWTIIGVNAFLVLGFFVSTLLFLNREFIIGFIILFLLIAVYTYVFINSFFKKVEISDFGVKLIGPLRKYELPWDNVKYIGIGTPFYGKGDVYGWLYFSSGYVSPRYIRPSMISNSFIMLRYRKALIKEVRKYWKGTVDGVFDLNESTE